MKNSNETGKLFNEDASLKDDCDLCKEGSYKVDQKTGYGAIIYKIGNLKNGWFATLSPKTGGNPKLDFTIQLMPFSHLIHFSQIESYPELAKNYGISFSKLCRAMTTILMQDEDLKANSKERNLSVSIGTYGKCTTWKEKKDHLHIKIFPFRGNIGQPYTVDSSFGKKELFKETHTGEEFVKMKPVKKVMIGEERFSQLIRNLISLLNK
jgi:hypothetical protein|tara:strand:+ start:271 stop:897 length:627 start_codon:yes stop_codon:yes gene_type:complete